MQDRDLSSPPTTPCSHSVFSGHSRCRKPQELCLGRAHWGVGREHVHWTEEPRRSDATGKHPLSLLLTQTLPLNHSLGLRTGGLCKHIARFQFEVHNSFLSTKSFFFFFSMQLTDPEPAVPDSQPLGRRLRGTKQHSLFLDWC